MTKQIRDYVLEARQIRESKEQKNEANLKVGDAVKVIDPESMAKGYKGIVDSINGSIIKVKLPDGPEGNMKNKFAIMPFKDKELQLLTEGVKKQKNEAEFKPKLSENELKRNVDASLKWLKVLLDDQKRKLKNGSWDEEEIEDTIDNVTSIINGLEAIKRDLMS